MTISLREFESQLEQIIGRPTVLRPLVCDGSPLDCEAFLVGLNPATSMSRGWWSYWKQGVGFDKQQWFADYLRERQEAPLKPGKTRRNRVSATRRVIEAIVENAAPVRCLETNVFSAEAATGAGLTAEARLTAPFDFLLRTIRPKVVVAHGDDAIEHLSRLTQSPLTWGNEADAGYQGHTFRLLAVAHFSRPRDGQGWSAGRAAELAQRIRSIVCASEK